MKVSEQVELVRRELLKLSSDELQLVLFDTLLKLPSDELQLVLSDIDQVLLLRNQPPDDEGDDHVIPPEDDIPFA